MMGEFLYRGQADDFFRSRYFLAAFAVVIPFGDAPSPIDNVAYVLDMKEDFLDTVAISERIFEERAALRRWERLLAERMKVFSSLL